MHLARGKRNQLYISVNRTIGSDEEPVRQNMKVGRREQERSASGHTEEAQ